MNSENGYDVEDLRPGMQATFSKTITEADVVLFAGVSGDNNAVHVNEEFALRIPRRRSSRWPTMDSRQTCSL
jgi:acyl dehydratase